MESGELGVHTAVKIAAKSSEEQRELMEDGPQAAVAKLKDSKSNCQEVSDSCPGGGEHNWVGDECIKCHEPYGNESDEDVDADYDADGDENSENDNSEGTNDEDDNDDEPHEISDKLPNDLAKQWKAAWWRYRKWEHTAIYDYGLAVNVCVTMLGKGYIILTPRVVKCRCGSDNGTLQYTSSHYYLQYRDHCDKCGKRLKYDQIAWDLDSGSMYKNENVRPLFKRGIKSPGRAIKKAASILGVSVPTKPKAK